ncbi:MAG: hypothetical protein QW270_02715 [Candidatus Bathyarchaeia archaeon]
MDYQGEPFVLIVGKGFIDAAQQALHKKFNIFNLLLEVNEKFTKLSGKEAKQWLKKATGSKNILKTQRGTTVIRVLLNLTVMVLALLVIATALMHMSNPALLLLTAFLALLNLVVMQRKLFHVHLRRT